MGTIQNLALASFIEIYLFECCLYLILICCLCMIEFQEDDVLALLRDEETAEDKKIHTDISDEDLEKLLDRSDLIVNDSNDDNFKAPVSAFPLKGPGWEVVIPTATGGMLSTLNCQFLVTIYGRSIKNLLFVV